MRRIAIALGLLAPGTAWASNGAGVRTPPVFPQAACITDVDRSVDPMFHLDIGLPREDFMVTDDEPEDSRRFQFFLVCEDVHRDLLEMPNWITVAEAEDAVMRGSIDARPPDDDILELRDDLRDCVFPMNAPSERMPITCAATQGGLDFDTSAVPAGNYVVRGYTYEPPLNLWSVRRGVVRIFDDPAQAPPSIGLRTPSLDGMQLRPGSPFPIRGCAASTCDAQVQYASLIEVGRDEAQWQTIETVTVGTFEIPFDPPESLVGQPLLIRAVASTREADTWIDHAEGTLLVFGDDDASDQPLGEPIEICGFFDAEAEPEGPQGLGELTCSDPPEDEMSSPEPHAGCACSSAGGPADRAGWLSLAVFALLSRRRRRRAAR